MKIIIRHIIILMALISMTIYLVWRLMFTLVPFSISYIGCIVSILLVASETLGVWNSFIFYIILWDPPKKANASIDLLDKLPTVDIFCTTYNEKLNVLMKTLIMCTKIKYPKELLNIYVCDDGNRNEVRELSNRLGINYIARPTHEHAKAGNLNYALKHSNGEIVVTLDADMVPKSDFLIKTIGFFADEKMGFVQAPQAFFNPDPFQYNLMSHIEVPNEQDFFMRELEAGRDKFNATMYVGSNTLFRRAALEKIGGFSVGCITEDVATGMLIQAAGFKSRFVKSVIAKGLSPEGWMELLHQRTRWCRGNIQAAKLWNPLTTKGLTVMQRILYTNGILYWYYGVQKLIYIIAPILFLLFSIPTFICNSYQLMYFWLPQMIFSYLAFNIVAGKYRTMFWSHIYEVSTAPTICLAAISETFGLKLDKFRVTQKGVIASSAKYNFSKGLPHIILFLLSVAGVARVLILYGLNLKALSIYWIALFWALYNMVGLYTAIVVVLDRPRRRATERFNIILPITIKSPIGEELSKGVSLNISETGVRTYLEREVTCNEVTVVFNRTSDIVNGNDKSKATNLMSINADVVYRKKENGNYIVALKFTNVSFEQYVKLISLLYDTRDIDESYVSGRKPWILLVYQSTVSILKSIFKKKSKNEVVYPVDYNYLELLTTNNKLSYEEVALLNRANKLMLAGELNEALIILKLLEGRVNSEFIKEVLHKTINRINAA